MTKMLLFTKFITCRFIWLPSWTFCLSTSAGELNSLFSSNITIFVIGRRRTWVRPGTCLSKTLRVTVHTTFFSSVSILTILAIGHWFSWQSSFNSTICISAETLFSTCSKFIQQCLEHVPIVFWNTDLWTKFSKWWHNYTRFQGEKIAWWYRCRGVCITKSLHS